ncbi:UNVERIFIED_CONTAM: hypothetical protein PYX00_003716 [Menopon gallinae]|uniref:LIM zinc-binding domain-containing protein n=1 Tax=Menopon gallinae TaxID=328185 RepID=A0AAW2I1J7_9NEOP
MPGTDRRNSLVSEDANAAPPVVRQMSQDGTEIIPTRMSKVTAPKPASNPLQFIKVGPCDLYKAAQEQIKKVEEIKKVEKVKDDSEDWQSNLDNWKCSRRKRQEHIIERVVEVKKLELEEHDRNRRRSKTFSEMLEERNSKGGMRKMTILTYPEDDESNDFSDLGISNNKQKSDSDFATNDQNGVDNNECQNTGNGTHCANNNRNSHRGLQDDESSTSATISSPEPEEYTYERAIQGYMNFAEAKIKTPIKSKNGPAKGMNGDVRISPPKKETGSKVGEKLCELEQIRLRSKSTNDLNSSSESKQLPRVDINKRRSLFENVDHIDTGAKDRSPKDIPNPTSIKERLSNLEKSNETMVKYNRPSEEVSTSIKDRLSSLERQTSADGSAKKAVNGDISPQISIKDRLSSLEKMNESNAKPSAAEEIVPPVSIKERVSSFDAAAASKEAPAKAVPERDASFKEKLENFKAGEQLPTEVSPEKEEVKENGFEKAEPNEEKQTEIVSPHLETEPEESMKGEILASQGPSGDGNAVTGEASTTDFKEVTRGDPKGEANNLVPTSGSPLSTNPVQVEESAQEVKTIVTEISLPESPSVSISLSVEKETKLEGDSEDDESHDQFPDLILPIESNKPKQRVRKLTPIMTSPKISISPLKAVCELQIIEEAEVAAAEEVKQAEDSSLPGDDLITVSMSPRGLDRIRRKSSEVQDIRSDGNEDSDICHDEQEETTVYTDENIDEVLGKDEELESAVDDDLGEMKELQNGFVKPEEPQRGPEIVELQMKKTETFLEKSQPIVPNYENIIINNQMSPDGIQLYGFPLVSPSPIEPPKEKPPPPPLDISDDEAPELPPKPSLRRLDSTKRIKKEIRKKRSDFLGIDGCNDDSYLEPDMYVTPPPDMMTFLQEERRLEQQLYRQSICSESDSNHETAESRDSGVELDRGHVDDIWSKPDIMSEPHSRQNSETFGNTSITSEEDEILKKEREIIEVLEKEEQWRYGSKNNGKNDIGEKLAVKLRQLEQEKMQLEWERAEEEGRRQAEESARREDEERLKAKEQQLREQEEALRSERERLQKEQERLERCRQNLMKQQQSDQMDVRRVVSPHRDLPPTRHSIHEVSLGMPLQDVPRHSMQDVSQPPYQSPMSSCYRYSMPDLQQRETRISRPPPPIPPAKPQRPMTQEQWERETNIRNSRIPSADNIPQQVDASNKLRHGSSVPAHINHGGQQMTRSTLQALSAAPRSRIISNENWMQAKRKSDPPKSNYNYQHWLIQEAEHRRILEHQQRASQPAARRPVQSYHPASPKNYAGTSPSHHTVGLPLTPSGHGQTPQKWMSPPRSDKPLPDAVIQTLTQRVQNRENKTSARRRMEVPMAPLQNKMCPPNPENYIQMNHPAESQERMLSVSGKKKCSHCNEELGRGAAMIIESLRLFYHIDCFKCCVCHIQLGDGLMGTDVRVRNNKLHCHNCYSSDDEASYCFQKIEVITGDESLQLACSSAPQEERMFYAVELPNPLPVGVDVPEWFRMFYNQYQKNENKKVILMQEMHLEMIDYEIRKCELLRDIIRKLHD